MLPDQFITIAEESGLIVPIGQWVLREACRQAKAWHHAGFPRLRLALNVSAVEPLEGARGRRRRYVGANPLGPSASCMCASRPGSAAVRPRLESSPGSDVVAIKENRDVEATTG